MQEHKEDNAKTNIDNLPLVHPDYDADIAQIAGLLLLFVGILVVVLLNS